MNGNPIRRPFDEMRGQLDEELDQPLSDDEVLDLYGCRIPSMLLVRGARPVAIGMLRFFLWLNRQTGLKLR